MKNKTKLVLSVGSLFFLSSCGVSKAEKTINTTQKEEDAISLTQSMKNKDDRVWFIVKGTSVTTESEIELAIKGGKTKETVILNDCVNLTVGDLKNVKDSDLWNYIKNETNDYYKNQGKQERLDKAEDQLGIILDLLEGNILGKEETATYEGISRGAYEKKSSEYKQLIEQLKSEKSYDFKELPFSVSVERDGTGNNIESEKLVIGTDRGLDGFETETYSPLKTYYSYSFYQKLLDSKVFDDTYIGLNGDEEALITRQLNKETIEFDK